MNQKERSSHVVGGFTLVGLGIGFLFIKVNVFMFLAVMFAAIGLGLVVGALIPDKRVDKFNTVEEASNRSK